MKLPPIDVYRAGFVEPFGCLTLIAARIDNRLIECLAYLTAGGVAQADDTHFANAADELWRGSKESTLICSGLINLPAEHREAFSDVLSRYFDFRERRNRAVHDAVELGFDDEEGAVSLAVRNPHGKKNARVQVARIVPEDVALLACEADEIRADVEFFLYRILEGEAK